VVAVSFSYFDIRTTPAAARMMTACVTARKGWRNVTQPVLEGVNEMIERRPCQRSGLRLPYEGSKSRARCHSLTAALFGMGVNWTGLGVLSDQTGHAA
jgi:hypothetical protein